MSTPTKPCITKSIIFIDIAGYYGIIVEKRPGMNIIPHLTPDLNVSALLFSPKILSELLFHLYISNSDIREARNNMNPNPESARSKLMYSLLLLFFHP